MKISNLAEIYIPTILELQQRSSGLKYQFMHLEPNFEIIESVKHDKNASTEVMREIRKVYTLGILERCHLSCIISLSRGERWLSGMIDALEKKNFLIFCSSLRGLLESSADAHDVLAYLPGAIKNYFRYIYLVLRKSKDIDNFQIGFGPLEEKLIHFAYAKKPESGVVPEPHHVAKSNKFYIEAFQNFDVPKLSNLYAELCQYAHPASPTVQGFMDEEPNNLTLNFRKDSIIIHDLLSRYEETIENLIIYSFNSALIGIAMLEKLNPDWPGPGDASLVSIGNWGQILFDLDMFMASYTVGSLNPEKILAGIN